MKSTDHSAGNVLKRERGVPTTWLRRANQQFSPKHRAAVWILAGALLAVYNQTLYSALKGSSIHLFPLYLPRRSQGCSGPWRGQQG
jgi:hypothetical protein